MKCIRCNHDSKYKDRAGGTCPSCHKTFAFEPKNGDPVTDGAFKDAIDKVSADGRIRFGVESVYYEVCRRLWRKRPKTYAPVAAVMCIPLVAIGLGGLHSWWGLLALVIVPLGLLFPRETTTPITPEAFRDLWNKYVSAHGEPRSLIARRSPAQMPEPPAEADLSDYSFDRAVICDRARTVDLLLANHFHFENSCAVLSVQGYPERPFAAVKAMLLRNPKLKVFALHDATPSGCRLAHRLRHDPEWFGPNAEVKVYDVGIRPRQAAKLRGTYQPVAEIMEPDPSLRTSEIKFLQKYYVELAAVRPERILKALFRAMNPKITTQVDAEVDITDVGGDVVDVMADLVDGAVDFSSDAIGDGGADSFG